MPRFLTFCGLLSFLMVLPAGLAAEEPRDVYRKAINGVVWIENFVANGSYTGSGFLVDRDRRLVVTNYHVTDGEETMDVFFPVRNQQGQLIGDREYYRKNRAALLKTGHYSPGRVVAYAPNKDLAVVALVTLPASAVVLETASVDPSNKDQLHILGNPGGRDLWRWSAAVRPSVGHFRGKYSGYPVEMDYKALTYSASGFGGNSGGPVLNDDGQVVGVHSSGGGEGGIAAGAVHWSEVDRLLSSITKYRVFSVENTSNVPIVYQVRWGDGEWKDWKVEPKKSMVHWFSGAKDARPSIRFDSSADPGIQEKKYDIVYFVSHLGRNVKPSRVMDAREYYFQYDKTGRLVDLYDRHKK
jgi:S1-C subfamily serine protease